MELEALRRVAREVSAASLRRARAASARRARGERAASARRAAALAAVSFWRESATAESARLGGRDERARLGAEIARA